jgi:hypothetical protein
VLLTFAAFAGPASAADPIDISGIPVAFATAEPLVGELVADEAGVVDAEFFVENRVCTVKGCRIFIFDKRSGALVFNDGYLSEAYGRTGRGKQVIRIKDFTDDERPKPAPDDKPLETAPAIKQVIRPSEEKTP